MAGYTRQDTTGQLANGNPIDADIFNDEYDAIEGAFNASTGHNHDGTVGGGAPIESIGPSQELEVTSSAVFPKVNNLIDLGKTGLKWKDGYFEGTVYTGDLTATGDATVGGNITVTGNATVNGNTIVGDAAGDTITVNAEFLSSLIPDATGLYNLGTSTQEWNDLFLDGTATVDLLVVDEDGTVAGNFDVTGNVGIDGDFDINTTKFTIEATTGNTLIDGTLDVNGVTNFNDLTSSTSTTTGAVIVDGGVGIAENVNIGGTLDVTGDATLVNMTATGTADITGAMGVDGNFDVGTTMFTVAAASGNTAIAGTLDVTGDTTVENLTVNGNTVLGDAATDTVTINTSTTAQSIIPATDSTYDLGDSSTYWQHGYIDAITTTGDVGVGGNVTITGDLTVSGTTTTVNSTTVDIADLNITVASGATTAAAANGGGITVAGASATLTYDSTTDRWDMNKDLEVANVYADLTGNVTGDVTGDVTGTVSDISNHTTDDLAEGSTNQFFTTARARGAISAGSGISYNSSTGAISVASSGTTTVSTLQASTVDLGDWTIVQSGSELHFKYGGTVRFKMTSAGTFKADDDVEAASF